MLYGRLKNLINIIYFTVNLKISLYLTVIRLNYVRIVYLFGKTPEILFLSDLARSRLLNPR